MMEAGLRKHKHMIKYYSDDSGCLFKIDNNKRVWFWDYIKWNFSLYHTHLIDKFYKEQTEITKQQAKQLYPEAFK